MMNYDYSSVTTCDNEELFALFSKIKTNPNPYDDSAVPLLITDLFHRLHLLGGMHWWIKTGDDLVACGVDVCKTTYLWATEYNIIIQGGFAGWLKASQRKFPALKELASIFGTEDVHLFMRVNFDELSQCTVTVDSPCKGFNTHLMVRRLNPHSFDLSFFGSDQETYDPACSLRIRLAATDDEDKILFVGRNKSLLEMVGDDHVILTDTDKSLAALANTPDVCFNEHIEKYLKENVKFCVVKQQV